MLAATAYRLYGKGEDHQPEGAGEIAMDHLVPALAHLQRCIGKAQRGKVAQLLTGHAVWFGGEWVVDTVATSIRFGDVSDADIEAYARSGQPLECAGAFTLEALGSWFIDAIDGDPTSVIGLSMPLLRRCLYRFGLDASDFWA